MKKHISILLALVMLISLVPTVSFAEETTVPAATPDANGHIMLFDLGNPATHVTAGYQDYAGTPSAFAYEGKSSSLKWEMDMTLEGERYVSNAPNLYLPYTASDLSAYSSSEEATVNVRFYSENAGSKFNIVFYGATTADYYRKDLTTIEGGWQVYQVLLKDIMAKLENYGTEKTLRVAFNDDGWNNLTNAGYNDGDTVYIDQIWVDTNADKYYENLATQADTKVLWKAENGIDTPHKATVTKKLSYDSIFNNYIELKFSLSAPSTTKIFSSSTKAFAKADGYDWINMWMYSEKPQENGVHFYFRSTTSGGTVKRVGINQIDWSGWKLISIPVPEQDVCRFDILGFNYRGNGEANSGYGDEIVVGIDGIWVTKGDISPQASYEEDLLSSTADSTPYETTADDLMNVNLNAGDNVFNPHIYSKNKRLSFKGVTYTDLVNYSDGTAIPDAKKTIFHAYDSETNSAADIIPTENSYINAWIYNPAPKYTWDGKNYAEIILVLRYRNGEDFVNKKAFIIANWEGWKLVSIPVTAFGSDLPGKNVYDVYFQCNGGWIPVSGGNIYSHAHTPEELALGYRTTGVHNVFGGYTGTYKYYNFYNYIDIERVWISEGAPKALVTITDADNSALKCPETAGEEIDLYTGSNVAYINANVISNNGSVCEKQNYALAKDGTLSIPGGLDYGTSYYAYAELYAPNGEKAIKEYSFTAENYHIGEVVLSNDGKTATVNMHGNINADYAEAILVAAVYDGGSSAELEYVLVGNAAQDGVATVTIPENIDITEKTVKFLFLDDIDNITPLKTNTHK